MGERYITRVDQQGKTHGWYFRIIRRDVEKTKFFPDRSSGGKEKALELAKKYRDEVIDSLPEPIQKELRLVGENPLQSGVPGVIHTTTKNNGKEYHYWQTSWLDDYDRVRVTTFSFLKYGKEEALRLAIKEKTDRENSRKKPT